MRFDVAPGSRGLKLPQMMPRRIPLALVLTLTLGTCALGQELNLRTLALKKGEMPEIFVKAAKKDEIAHKLDWPARQPSELVKVPAAGSIAMLTREVDGEGAETFKAAQQVEVPAGANGVLLLGWKEGDNTRIVALKDEFVGARFNDWLLVNSTAKPIAFRAGEGSKTLVVRPGSSETYKLDGNAERGAEVLVQTPEDGEAKTIYSTYWPVREGRRAIVLFIDDGKKIRVKRISDHLLPPKPEE